MRNGDANGTVRILPADDSPPPGIATPTEPPRPQRWFIPLLVVAGALGVFVVATRPTSSDSAVPTTRPAPIAAVDADLVDLQTEPRAAATSEWAAQDFDWPGQINDILRVGSSFVAVGSTPHGAHVWQSNTGGNWRDVGRLELPEAAETSIDHAVNWTGEVVALGSVDNAVGLWIATYGSNWSYHGLIDTIDTDHIGGLAAGPELLAVSGREGQVHGWMSSDGLEWKAMGPISDLDGAVILDIAATDDWYFAFGQADCGTTCDAVIYRSADGIDWTLVATELSSAGGVVVDMAATPDGLLATGWVNGPLGVAVAVWESDDGAEWTRLADDAAALQPVSITVELVTALSGGNPVAEISVDGSTEEVTTGTEILTDVGGLTVGAITDSSVELVPGLGRAIEVSGTSTVTAIGSPKHVAAEGPRIVVSGYVTTGGAPLPAVWISADRGATWSRQVLEGTGHVNAVGIAGRNIVAVGGNQQGPLTWRAGWDTEASRLAGEVAATAYLSALNNRDAAHLVGLLPKTNAGDIPPEFMVPSLGENVHGWWDTDTGRLNPDRVVETLDYLKATTTSIEVGECSSGATLGIADRVNVRCEYTVDSSLLALFGTEGHTGHINALVRNGILTTVTLDAAPSINMWQILSSRVNGAETRDISTQSGDEIATIEFTRTSADEHHAAAEQLLAGVLSPGSSITVDTALGTMEWSWVRAPDFDTDHLGSMSWSDFGFVASGYHEPSGANPSFAAWTSPDGETWAEIDTPELWDAFWDMQPFHNGVIGVVSQRGTVGLAYYDGSEWTEISLTPPGETSYLDIARIAVSQDQIMAITGWWQEDGLLLNEALLIGPDLVPHVVELPPEDSWAETNIQLAGSDRGFVLGTTSYYEPHAGLSIWHSSDGFDWTLLADTEPLGDAQFVWNLQEHRSQYFVVGEGSEMRCTTSTAGENCAAAIQLWSSPDGVAWDRVITKSGEPVSTYEIGSGPLGLVAFSQELTDSTLPRSVFFSTDGAEWTTEGDLALLNPVSEWWYIDTPAVGTDTVIAVGYSFDPLGSSQQEQQTFLIVGRMTGET